MNNSRKLWIQTYGCSNRGAWFNLDQFDDLEALEAKCVELFGEGAEYGVFDYQEFPFRLPSESVSEAWAWHEALTEADDEEQLAAFVQARGVHYYNTPGEYLEKYEDAFMGEAESEKEYAEQYAVERFDLPDGYPEGDPRTCIDWQWYWDAYVQYKVASVQISACRYMFFDALSD